LRNGRFERTERPGGRKHCDKTKADRHN